LEWFLFLLFQRHVKFSPILAGRSLLQEFITDSWVVVERGRLQYIYHNQDKMKAHKYKKLIESLENEEVLEGRRIILPSSFIGGPRAMSQLYQDSMAICRKFGTPLLFITMTANLEWPEVLAEIPPGDKAYDHPTVVARIFYLKVKELIYQLVKMEQLGKVVAYVYTIEFQKRGLPHLHLMLTLDEKDCPTTPEHIDLLVNAELPDPKKEPRLAELVTKFMLHGPCCQLACWDGKNCKYGYPKPPSKRTVIIKGAYPAYQRRESNLMVKKGASTFTNSHVVPHNKFLTLMFECHINVKIPVSTTAIKYLYKYITKGHNRSYLKVDGCDKTAAYLDARYVSALEG
jgi:hypothetical protein